MKVEVLEPTSRGIPQSYRLQWGQSARRASLDPLLRPRYQRQFGLFVVLAFARSRTVRDRASERTETRIVGLAAVGFGALWKRDRDLLRLRRQQKERGVDLFPRPSLCVRRDRLARTSRTVPRRRAGDFQQFQRATTTPRAKALIHGGKPKRSGLRR